MVNDLVTLIIRSVNERTEDLCKKLIIDQGVRESNIYIVEETPFSAAMKKSYEIGIDKKLPWTFCIDADVLLRPGCIEHMMKIALKQKSNVCEIQGLVLDKFFGGPRPAGNHLFRTSLLHKVINRIPEEGVSIRPEYFTLKQMRTDGYPWYVIPYIVGIHDDEQYNRDIYRKCFVQGIKHLSLAHMLIDIWKSYCFADHDFNVALRAFADSIQYTEQVFINSKDHVYETNFIKASFVEKSKIDINNYSLDIIEKNIQNFKCHEAYLKEFPKMWGLKKSEGVLKKVKNSYSTRGLIRSVPYIFGKSLIEIGQKLTDAGKK